MSIVKSEGDDAHDTALQGCCAHEARPEAWHAHLEVERQQYSQWKPKAPVRHQIDGSSCKGQAHLLLTLAGGSAYAINTVKAIEKN